MRRFFPTLVAGLTLIGLAGCGPAPAPTLRVPDIQSTGFALASTGIAMTKAALPTATVPPPTDTPLPLPTSFPTVLSDIPTLGSVGGTPTDNPCNMPPPLKAKGNWVAVKLKNATGGDVNLALGMNAPNALGECGTWSFSLGPYGEPTAHVLVGCYWGFGWVTAKKPSTSKSTQSMCLTEGGHVYEITIGPETMAISG